MALEYDLKRGEEVWLLLNKETAKFTNSIMNLGLTFQDLQSLIAHERYDLGGQYGMSPILAYTLMKARMEQDIRAMATKTNNRVFHNHLVQEAIDELMSTSYFFFMERIKKYDLNSGVYFDRYVSPYLNDFYRDSIQKTYLGYTERDSDAISVSNATKSLDEQYNYDIDDDGYSKIDVESNCSDMKNPESIYILNENKEGSSVLEKYIDDKGYELEEKDLFYFNFINSFMGGPDIISPEFYTKEINFFFGEKEPEMVQE